MTLTADQQATLAAALKAGPPYTPEVLNLILQAAFGASAQASPVPGIFNAQNAKLLAAQASYQTALASSQTAVVSFLANNPGILTSPQTTSPQVWAGLGQAAAQVNSLLEVQNDFTAALNALQAWYQTNQGSLTPLPLPAVPQDVQAYFS